MAIALGFLHPLLLWALPLALVPILIHLLNRRRYRTVRWAAMEQLLAALKRNRRRLRMEQWLLLAMRVLIVLLLIFAVSRPQTSGSVLGDVRTHHVVCLDDSASMTHLRGATTAFDEAVQSIERLVTDLAETRRDDLLTLVVSSAPTAPVMLAMNLGPQTVGEVRAALAELRVGDGAVDFADLFQQVRARIEGTPEASRAEVYVVTDLRRVDWLADSGEVFPGIHRELASLDPESHRVTVVSVSSNDTENLAIESVRRSAPIAPTGVPLQLIAHVVNRGEQPSQPTEVGFEVDGASRVLRQIDSLSPGEGRDVAISYPFQTPGSHGLEVTLPRDKFALDDSRAMALDIVESSRALLVDGDPGEAPEESETYCLVAALEHTQSGIAIEVIPDHALPNQDLSHYDVVYLCNVPVPDEATVRALEDFARAGGGVVVFAGDQVDASRYNDALYREGAGLLPVALTGLDGDLDRPENVFVADSSYGALRTATENLEQMFARLVLVGRWMGVAETTERPAKVVLRVRDNEGPPLMVSRNFEGGGEVVLVTTTADTRWTNWPSWPAFLIVSQEVHRLVARPTSDDDVNLGQAGTLVLPVDPGLYRPDVVVRSREDEGVERTFTAQSDQPGDMEASVSIPMGDLRGFGLFEMQLTPHSGNRETRLFARNPPEAESRLAKADTGRLSLAMPEDVRDRIRFVERDHGASVVTAGQGEIWRILALSMLLLMIAESVAAWRFGRR